VEALKILLNLGIASTPWPRVAEKLPCTARRAASKAPETGAEFPKIPGLASEPKPASRQ
jgi:hypothetical protein